MRSSILILACSIIAGCTAQCPEFDPNRYLDDIQKIDPSSSDARDAHIVLIGASTVRFLPKIPDIFPVGFGGATLAGVQGNIDRILPRDAETIALHCGENDVEGGCGVDVVLDRLAQLFDTIHTKLPDSCFLYVEMKPTILRWNLRSKLMEINARTETELLPSRPYIHLIHIWDAFLDEHGNPDPKYYREDKLHLSPLGEKIFVELIEDMARKV